jgi:hypothetical protein
VAQLNKIASGDPATNAARKFGSFLDNKMIGASGIGGGLAAGFGTGNPGFGLLAGTAVAGGVAGGANLLKKASAAGTEEQVQNFRRIMTRTPKYTGPISVAERNRIAKMAREGVLNYYGDE